MDVKQPAITCRASDTLEHVIDVLAVSNIHRIFEIDDPSRPLRVISLTDVIGVCIDDIPGYDVSVPKDFVVPEGY